MHAAESVNRSLSNDVKVCIGFYLDSYSLFPPLEDHFLIFGQKTPIAKIVLDILPLSKSARKFAICRFLKREMRIFWQMVPKLEDI